MRRSIPWLVVVLLALGCASAGKLARRSDEALRAGDPDRAWRDARAALARHRHDPQARAAGFAAAAALEADWEHRLGTIAAAGDTLAAAEAARGLTAFRREAAGFDVAVTPGAGFETAWTRWRTTAAARHYAMGREAERAGDAKRAWLAYHEASGYVPGFRDLGRRMERVWAAAETRVAVAPFDARDVSPELARQAADALHDALAEHLDPDAFLFTRLVPASRVWSNVTVAELDGIDRTEALRIGQAVGAQRVVFGRIGTPRTDTQLDHWHEPLWRQVTVVGDSGRKVTRWESQSFEAVTRTRTVAFDVTIDVLDVATGASLGQVEDSPSVTARSVWTRGGLPGDAAAWRVCPPDRPRDERQHLEEQWREAFGGWSVRRMLERARHGGGSPDVSAWRAACSGDPVFAMEPPPVPPMTMVALDHTWPDVLERLRDLDRR